MSCVKCIDEHLTFEVPPNSTATNSCICDCHCHVEFKL